MPLVGVFDNLDYDINRGRMEKATSEAIALSRLMANKPSQDSRLFYASLLFTSLCTRSFTFLRVCPEQSTETREGFWDFATAAAMARSIMEVRLTLFYLTEDCPDEEAHCRLDIMNIHDCTSRIKLFTNMSSMGHDYSSEVVGFEGQLRPLQERLKKNAVFSALPKGIQTGHLNGSKAYMESLENIGIRCGIKTADFRLFYQLWSTQAHGLPLAFYRMASNGVGRGVHSKQEEFYTSLCLSICSQLINDAMGDYRGVWKRLTKPGHLGLKPSTLLQRLVRKAK